MEVSGRKFDDILCEPCNDNGQKHLAEGFCVDCCEFLCSLCYKHHCRKHVLQDKKTMPRIKPEFTTTQLIENGDKCVKHRDEIIKFYCRSDRQLGCGSCMITNHRKCEELLSIEEEYEKFDKEIQDFGLKLDKNFQTKDQNSIEIEKHHTQAVKDIKLLMKEIKEYFENIENKIISDIDKVMNADKKTMVSISATCMTLRNDLQSLTSDLSKLHKTQQNEKLYIKMEEARDQMKIIAKDINGMSNDNKVLKYTFVPEKQVEDLIRNVTALGNLNIDVEPDTNGQTEILESSHEIKTTYMNLHATGNTTTAIASQTAIQTMSTVPHIKSQTVTDQATAEPDILNYDARRNVQTASADQSTSFTRVTTDIQHYPFKPRQISEVSGITAESSSDKETIWVTGIALLPDDQLVLVDHNNIKVKLVNTKQNRTVTELKLSSSPWDITAVNNDLVAMTMPYANGIQLVSVTNSKLLQGQTIKVKGQCYGIVHNNGTFIVTNDKPAKIEILSMTGNVLKVIDKGPNGVSLFELPWYITLSPDNTHVYISDYSNHTVTCMTLDGNVNGIYKYDNDLLKCPTGLTVDKRGSVYVGCNYIYQISGDCSQGKILLGSILTERTWPISYCHKEDKLYVGYDKSNSIKVLKLKHEKKVKYNKHNFSNFIQKQI